MSQEEGEVTKSQGKQQKNCLHHTFQRPNWFCVDTNCKESNRFTCGDCVLDYPHFEHQHKKLIDYEGIIKKRCPERLAKLRELQQVSEIKTSTAELFKNIRDDFNNQVTNLERSVEKQIRKIEHNFSSRQLTEFNQKVRNLQNKLFLCRFLFCDEDLSDLSLQLYNHPQFLEPAIEKEKQKRELICSQFKDHLTNIQQSYDHFSSSIQNFATTFQAASPNMFNLENFTQKVSRIDESKSAHSLAINTVVALSNNRLMSFSDDTTMQIFNQNFQLINTIKHDSKINHADILSENVVVITSADYKISVYNIEKNELVKKYTAHTEPILAIKAIDENRFVSGGIDRNLYIWSLDQDEPLLKSEDVHEGFIYCIEQLGVNKFATSGGDDGKIKIWQDLKVVQALNGHSNKVQNLKYLEGQNILVSADDHGVIMLWNLSDLTLIHQFREEYEEPLIDIIQLSEDAFAVLGVEQVLKIFKIEYEKNDASDQEQAGSNELLDKESLGQGKRITKISAVMSFSTYLNVNTITKFDDDIIVGGCQDGHLVIIK